MSSKDIYTPYFYIIQHKESKKLYAGSRYAKGCHPNEFMQPNGYTTSSNTINDIINQEGLDSFEILRIDANCDGLHPYDYETLFLETIDCANSPNWYNGHNNTAPPSFGTLEYSQILLRKYGVDHPSKISGFDEKVKETKLKRYNNPNYNNPEKVKETNIKNLGVLYPGQSELCKHKAKETKLKRYNNPNYNNREKASKSYLEKYGVDHPSKISGFDEKVKETKLKNFGNSNYNNPEKIKETKLKNFGNSNYNNPEKYSKTCQEKYGVSNTFQSEEIKQKIKETNIINTGYEYPTQVPFFSIIKTKKTYAKNIISRLYPELKQFY
jgi:hypothetical protein